MTTDLSTFINSSPLCSTHEHTEYDRFYREATHDVLTNLFDNYVVGDLVSAGANPAAVKALLDVHNPDIRARFDGIKHVWPFVRNTGYGEGVRIIAKELYQIEDLTSDLLQSAQDANPPFGRPGERLRILRDLANLDHVQIDPTFRPFSPEMAGQSFFHYDINLFDFCSGRIDPQNLAPEIGQEIASLTDLRDSLVAIFDRSARYAIAIKSQHAYSRTLRWRERSDAEAAVALAALLRRGSDMTEDERLCLGDWCTGKIVELSIEYKLPFKIHTGYYAGNDPMPVDFIWSGNLCALLSKYPSAKFVLMHIAYPYSDEVIAIAKHYPNVTIDMCWAWSINAYHSADFLLRYLHAAPLNKLMVFGGDSYLPAASLAYSIQLRKWLVRTLENAVDEEQFTEADAISIARRLMLLNAYDLFDVKNKSEVLLNTRATEQLSNSLNPSDSIFSDPKGSIREGGKTQLQL